MGTLWSKSKDETTQTVLVTTPRYLRSPQCMAPAKTFCFPETISELVGDVDHDPL